MTTPSLGDIVYLASCAIQLGVSAVTTGPDTPNQYTADLKVMGDTGDISLDAVVGPPGPNGQATFALRSAPDLGYPLVNNPDELPTLTNTTEDIGKYWLIDTLDDAGHLLSEWCYIWWGTYYRQIMMGVIGQPGPVPQVDILMTVVADTLPTQVLTSGSTLAPTWQFMIPAPPGTPGPIGAVYGFPDVNEIATAPPTGLSAAGSGTGGTLAAHEYFYVITGINANGETTPSAEVNATTTGTTSKVVLTWTAGGTANTGLRIYRGLATGAEDLLLATVAGSSTTFTDTGSEITSSQVPPLTSVLAYTGLTAPDGSPEWVPFDIDQFLPQTWSMPQSEFTPYTGISQQAPIGSFSLPPQPFPWTPIVWGHLSAGGLSLGSDPLMIGCQVLLDNQTGGQQVGRGLGTELGEINIVPHYSTPTNPNANITPNNGMAVIAATPSGTAASGSTIGGALAAHTYFYVVTAVTRDGETAPSTEVSVTTTGTTSSVLLTWTAAPGPPVFNYKVYRGTSSGAENVLVATTNGVTQTVTDIGASPVTASPPPPTTLYINLWNDGQLGFYSFSPTPSPAPFQGFLDALLNAIEHPVATIEEVVTLLGSWVLAVPSQIQTQLNAVAHVIGTSAIGTAVSGGINDVAQYLTSFEPLVNELATALGITEIENVIDQVITELETFASTITTEIQDALDSVANRLGLPGIGNPVSDVLSQLQTLQPAIQSLADLLGQNSISSVLTALGAFVGSVTTPIQTALDGVANSLGFSGTGHSILNVTGYLTDFQTNIDGVASELGITGVGNTIEGLIGFLAPWVTGTITGGVGTAIGVLLDFLGETGLEPIVINLLNILLGLLGDLFSGYTTDAQMFVMVLPMLEGTGL
jgi:hypothetical protein